MRKILSLVTLIPLLLFSGLADAGVIATGNTGGGGGGGGDTITSPNATISVGGTSSNTTLDVANPLKLGSGGFTPTAGTIAAQFTGTTNNYYQVSIQNLSSGASASSDFVATANDGDDTTHYVDFGINGSGGGTAPFTAAHAAYLYSVDNELDLGAIGATGTINLATGTTPTTALSINSSQVSAFSGQITDSFTAAASTPALLFTTPAYTGGTTTTNTPTVYINPGVTAPTTWSTGGTYLGVNADSGFAGNFLDFHVNGGGSVFSVASTGGLTSAGASTFSANGASSASALNITGNTFAGTGTTATPLVYFNNDATQPTSWATSGTYLGFNVVNGFAGNILDIHVHGGSSTMFINSAGTITTQGVLTLTRGSNASQATQLFSGALFTGGTGTTTFPDELFQHTGSAVTTWSTGGTYLGVNADSGFAGNFLDFHVNGGGSVFKVDQGGNTTLVNSSALTTGQIIAQGRIASSSAGGASAAVFGTTGALLTGQTGTTNFPQYFAQPSGATAVTAWSTNGTFIGVNAASGFSGNFIDLHTNGGASLYSVSSAGGLSASTGQFSGILTTQSGRVHATRVVTAAGAVTVATTDDVVIVNKTSGAATTVNLPASPTTGTEFVIKDGKGDAATNNITVTPAAGNIDGAPTAVINTNYGSDTIVYNGTQWNII